MNFDINGKIVNIVINLENYSLRKFNLDFKDLLKYQTKNEELDLNSNRQFDLKRIYEGILPIKYEDFQRIINLFLPKIILFFLKEHQEIITSDNFEIQIKIVRVPKREYYGVYDPEISDKNYAYIEVSGLWLLNSLVVPWVVSKKIDWGLISKFLVHELYHHVDYIANAFIYEDKLQEKWNLRSKEMSHYGILFLFCVLLEIRAEGYAEFASKDYRKFVIDPTMIKEFRKNIRELVTISKRNDAELFFAKKLSTESYSTYYCGNIMCFFIALYFSKRSLNVPKIVYNNRESLLSNLGSFLETGKKVSIVNLSPKVYSFALSSINQMGPIEFLNMYNLACDDLGISNNNKVLNWTEFNELKKIALNSAESRRIKAVKKKGYMIKG